MTTETIKQGTYSEDGWVADVEILEDNSDTERLKFKLKVLRTHRFSPIHGHVPEGTEFEVRKLRSAADYGCMWQLDIDTTDG